MRSAFEKLLASVGIGLVLPLLLFRFQIHPWSEPVRYWLVFLLCFAIAFLVYKYRNPGEDRIPFKTHAINLVISFVVLCVVAIVYLLILATLYAVL